MIEVTLKQAVDFAALGYPIKCYVEAPHVPVAPHKRRQSPRHISKDARIALSLKHGGPSKGKMVAHWEVARKVLWGREQLKTYMRSEVDTALRAAGADATTFSYLIKLGCIREVPAKS